MSLFCNCIIMSEELTVLQKHVVFHCCMVLFKHMHTVVWTWPRVYGISAMHTHHDSVTHYNTKQLMACVASNLYLPQPRAQ